MKENKEPKVRMTKAEFIEIYKTNFEQLLIINTCMMSTPPLFRLKI